MDQIKNLADPRLVNGCVYCLGPCTTREHVPSKVFLDKPFPENLPTVGSCLPCNNGFSKDEAFVACLFEAAAASSTQPQAIKREGIARMLTAWPALRQRIDDFLFKNPTRAELDRIERVLVKLAIGHSVFELSQVPVGTPTRVFWCPLDLMTEEQIDDFDTAEFKHSVGEIGSRSVQRTGVLQVKLMSDDGGEQRSIGLLMNDWVDVQEDRYRYHASDDGERIRIRMILGKFIAAEVSWLWRTLNT